MADPAPARPPHEDPPPPADGEPSGGAARRAPLAMAVGDVLLVGVCAWFLGRDYAAALAGEVAFQARTWTFMLNLTCTFVLAHRGVALLQRGVHDPALRRALGVVKWLAALVLPLLVATHLEREVQHAHRRNIEALATDIAARTQRAVHEQGHVAPADLASVQSPYLSSLSVRTDTGEFLLQVSIPGVDIDGYSGVWASTEGRWHIHRSDAPPEQPPAFDASGPILACNPGGDSLTCQ